MLPTMLSKKFRSKTSLSSKRRSSARSHRSAGLGIESLEQREMLSTVPPTVSGVSVSSSAWGQDFLDYLQTSGLGGEAGYAIPTGSAAQSTALPWSDLDRISITFSEDVDIQASDLAITGVTNTNYTVDHFFYDPVAKNATWTLTTPLASQERVLLDLDGDGLDPVADLDGNLLDGEWTDEVSTFDSGNGTAGGDFEFRFNVLEGDAYTTGNVDYYDYIYILYAVGLDTLDTGYNASYDLDGDGLIETADWQEALSHLWTNLPTGTPAGVGNDAPSTAGFDLSTITDRSADTIISLDAAFDDYEDPDSSLTYSIRSQTNSSLFDNVSIDSTNGELALNAAATGSGRSEIVIVATDTGGVEVETTLTVDVDRSNAAPFIPSFFAHQLGEFEWQFNGTVTDSDDNVEGMLVELTGLFSQRVAVLADGSFFFEAILSAGAGGYLHAQAWDGQGGVSNNPLAYAGI